MMHHCDNSVHLGLQVVQTKAEQAAWEIVKKEGIELVVINPSLVLGELMKCCQIMIKNWSFPLHQHHT